MKVGFIIIGRLKSTRLPKKLLLDLGGKPVITQMINRIKQANSIDTIILATSTNAQDDELAGIAKENDIECFRGDETDVLARIDQAAKSNDLDYIVHVTADCPLVDPSYIDRIVEHYQACKIQPDLITCFDLPHGAFSYGIKLAALKTVMEIKQTDDTEVWGKYFTDMDCFNVHALKVDDGHKKQLRLTLDYPEDYQMLKQLYAAFENCLDSVQLNAIIEYCGQHPELTDINRSCDARYRKRSSAQGGLSIKPRYDANKALIVGCGSIGKKHIRNLKALGITDIVALRTKKGATKELPTELGVDECFSWEEVDRHRCDFAVIANPSSMHIDTMRQLMGRVKGIFIEKPLSHCLEGLSAMRSLIAKYKPVTFVGFNLRFHPMIMKISQILDSGKLGQPITLQIQVGQWLPDWHPDEDHKKLYAANQSMGGGALLSLIHEVQMALDWAGPFRRVTATFPKSDLLDLDVDVKANLMIEHASGAISQIHIDLIQRPASRSGTIICQKGSIKYDLIKNTLVVDGSDIDNGQLSDFQEASDYAYFDMMRSFLQLVREGRYRHAYDFDSGIESLALAHKAFEAYATNQWLTADV